MPVRHRFLFCLIVMVVCGGKPVWAQWQAIGPYGGHAHKIAVHPTDSNRLYAATKKGQIYLSTDAGQRWKAVSFTLNSAASLSTLSLNPRNPGELFVGVSRNYTTADPLGDTSGDAGVYKSSDGGLHWTRLQQTRGWSVFSLAIHSVQTNVVLAGTEEGVFRSDDGGSTWRQISPKNHPHIKAVVSLAVDPANSRVIYAGTTHLPWKTADGGITWQSIHEGMADDSDVFSIAINSTNSRSLVLGACSGIYRTGSGTNTAVYDFAFSTTPQDRLLAASSRGLLYSEDSGRTWTQVNGGLPATRFDQILLVPDRPEDLYVLSRDNHQMWRSTDAGAEWTKLDSVGLEGALLRFMGVDAGQPFVVTENHGVFKHGAPEGIAQALLQTP